MNKVILITANIAPYRLLWCEELAKFFDVTIFYTKEKEKNYNDDFLKHSSNICNIIRLSPNKKGNNPICFDVIKAIKDNKNSFIIFDGYGPLTNLLGLLYCKLINKKTYVNVDGYPTERKKNKIKELLRSIVIGKLCTNFFCSSQIVKEYLVRYGANPINIYIHNFSSIINKKIVKKPINKNEKIKLRKKYKLNINGKLVLGVGRFVELKRFNDLINAVLMCDAKCDLLLLGGKPTKQYLDIVGNNKNIHFIDFVLPENVDDYYKMADLLVLPSETDVWGLVLNEAMAQGLPIISSDSVIGGKSMINGNGMIFETYNVKQLCECIELCLKTNNNSKMSKKSLEIIKNYTIEGMVKRQLPIINQYFKI